MKTFTYEDIKAMDPCYDPIKYIPKDWKGNALDILKLEGPSISDKFFIVFKQGLISDKILRLFAVWSYRETLKFIKDPDPRSLKAAEVAEAYALGKATDEELEMVGKEAWAAWSAIESEVESAAELAARAAAESAGRETAAIAATNLEARSALWPISAESAAWSARSAAELAARAAAESAQLSKLIELLEV